MDEVSSHVCLVLPSTDGKAARKIVPPRLRIPYWKGLGADSEEKHEPVSDIDTVVVDSLKALDPKRPIREADICQRARLIRFLPLPTDSCSTANQQIALLFDYLVRAGEQRRR
jgi:hypothetical protein